MSADHEKILHTPPQPYPHSPDYYNNINGSVVGSEVSALTQQPYPQGHGNNAQFQYPQATEITGVPQQYQTSPTTHDISSPPTQPQANNHPLQQFHHQNGYPPEQQQQQQQHPKMAQQPQLHPTAYGQQGGEWQASLCDCSPCSSCLLGWCLPCILVGQTSERIRDPSMQNADLLNSDCLIHGAITCFTGCGWIYAMLKRSEIRERYNIQGSGCNDCCVSYWCSCCAVIQQDNEVKIRQRNAQPVQQGYVSQPGMQMPGAPSPAYSPQPLPK